MTIRRLAAAFLVLLCTGLWSWSQSGSTVNKPFPVSLIRVIGNPEKFADRNLRVIGFLDYGGGLDRAVCLYVSEIDARNVVMPNCIYVRRGFDRGDKHLGKYVIFNATLRYAAGNDGSDHLSFEDISDIRLWPTYEQ